VGIGENKLQAKIATGFGKPAGVFRLTFASWFSVLGGRPVDALWGIGAKTAKKLAGLGIATVSDLAAADPDALASEFGPMTGPWLVLLAQGRGDTEVDASPYVAKAHGREETFQRNIADWPQVEAEVARIAGLLARDLAAEPRPAVRVVVKVRYAPFVTETHGVTLESPSSEAAVIAAAAAQALGLFTGRRPVRLLGVRAQFESGARLAGPLSERAGHAELAEGGVGGQRLALGGGGEAAALVEAAGRLVGLGHPEVDGFGVPVSGPGDDRVDQGLADAVAAGLRADEHGDELDHARLFFEAAGQPGWAAWLGWLGVGEEGEEGAVAGGAPLPFGWLEGGIPGVGRAEGVRGVPQGLQPDLPHRLPVVKRRRAHQDHAFIVASGPGAGQLIFRRARAVCSVLAVVHA
jgi:hypothetical protein